jgi:SnoaL-like domain
VVDERSGDPRRRLWSGQERLARGQRDFPLGRIAILELQAYDFELVAAGVNGDLAYTVGYEYSEVSRDGGPVNPNTLRVTHVYRREDGEWKIVHRHADGLPSDQGPADATTRV